MKRKSLFTTLGLLVSLFLAATVFARAAPTSNLGMQKPDYSESGRVWQSVINQDLDAIDAAYGTFSARINSVASEISDSPEVHFEAGTFNGSTGTAITLPKAVSATTEYGVAVVPTTRSGAIGDIYVDQGTTTVTIKCVENNTTDTFLAIIWYKGVLNAYGNSQYREWIVSPDAAITDHGAVATVGSLAWVMNEATGTAVNVRLPGNHTYPLLQNITIPSGVRLIFDNGAILQTNYAVAGGGSAWTVVSGSIYQATLANEPATLTESGTVLTKVANVGSIDAAGKWCWNAGQIMVWTTGSVDPDSLVAGVLMAGHSVTFASGSSLQPSVGQIFSANPGDVLISAAFLSDDPTWWYGGNWDNALACAIAAPASAGADVMINKAITAAVAVTIPSNINLSFGRGGKITATDCAVTINCSISAGPYQIFATSGTGSFAGTPIADAALVQWFGAVADYSGGTGTDCGPAIQSSVTLFSKSVIPRGSYYVNTMVSLPSSRVLSGYGATIYGGTGITAGTSVFQIAGTAEDGSDAKQNSRIEGMSIDLNGALIGIAVRGSYSCVISGVRVLDSLDTADAVGIKIANSFHVLVETCRVVDLNPTSGIGVWIYSTAAAGDGEGKYTVVDNIEINNCYFIGCWKLASLDFEHASNNILFLNTSFQKSNLTDGSGQYGIWQRGYCDYVKVQNCHFESMEELIYVSNTHWEPAPTSAFVAGNHFNISLDQVRITQSTAIDSKIFQLYGTGTLMVKQIDAETGSATHPGVIFAHIDSTVKVILESQIEFNGSDFLLEPADLSELSGKFYSNFKNLRIDKGASYTMKRTQSGINHTNGNATGTITFTLPRADVAGLIYPISQYKSEDVYVVPDVTAPADQIMSLTDTAGDRILASGTGAAVGASVTLVSDEDGKWWPQVQVGTWSDAGATP